MSSLVGFTISTYLSERHAGAVVSAHERALSQFGHLERRSLKIGAATLDVWGHKGMEERIHSLPDDSLAVLVGSPNGKISWVDVQDSLLSNDFELTWEGRVILLRISADGKCWTMWNDWLGSIPVFHAQVGQGRIASTLEPAVVAAGGYTPDDFFLPGLMSLLINGHYLADWTLYKEMKVVPPDSASTWDENGFRVKQVWSVVPSQERWETGWDDLVDEMHELSHKAIADILKTQSTWILPLSSGMDSRLVAGVAADVGANIYTYAWGAPDTTDVIYSRQIAKKLGYPWKRIELPRDFMTKYTPCWAGLFGSAMHFHGMYQMAFLDALQEEPAGVVLSGFIGDVLAGDDVIALSEVHSSRSMQVYDDWHVHWAAKDVPAALKKPVNGAMAELASALECQINAFSGSRFQNLLFMELWSRQRFFTYFQSTLSDHWRGVASPFMNRDYARFCMSLPRIALDNRRLLGDVFRRYYGRLAVIPGTYHKEPFILTGRYLLSNRIAKSMPAPFRRRFFAGFDNIPLRMDIESIRAEGRKAVWPLFEAREKMSEWLDFTQLEQDFQTIMRSQEDIRPLRRLQSAQTLAYRLLHPLQDNI